MQFIGTRSGERVSAPEAVYNGLSAGGGLYVPVSFPLVGKAEREKMEDMSYAERAKYILSLYFGEFGDEFLTSVSESALKGFEGKDEVPLVLAATVNPFKCPQDVLYCISGNDVKDSYKGVKRLNLLTAMKPPKFVTELRNIEPRFKDVLPAEGKRLTAALLDFVDGNFVPETKKKR